MSYWRFIRLIVIKTTHKILVQLLCHFYSCAYVIPDVGLLRCCWVTVSVANGIKQSPKFQANKLLWRVKGIQWMVWQMEEFIMGTSYWGLIQSISITCLFFYDPELCEKVPGPSYWKWRVHVHMDVYLLMWIVCE